MSGWSAPAAAKGATAAQIPALRECLLLKPRSTVDDVFAALKRSGRLAGEFVRAEGCGVARERRRQLRKDDVVAAEHASCILRIMTNRKANGQRAASRVT